LAERHASEVQLARRPRDVVFGVAIVRHGDDGIDGGRYVSRSCHDWPRPRGRPERDLTFHHRDTHRAVLAVCPHVEPRADVLYHRALRMDDERPIGIVHDVEIRLAGDIYVATLLAERRRVLDPRRRPEHHVRSVGERHPRTLPDGGHDVTWESDPEPGGQ